MEVGDALALEGRLQSRLYTKEVDGQPQERTAFEVSIMSLPDPPPSRPTVHIDSHHTSEYDGDRIF